LPNSTPSATPFHAFSREDAGQQRADRAADAVRGDDVERVVERVCARRPAEVARERRDAPSAARSSG
jgi:hypothetical protein